MAKFYQNAGEPNSKMNWVSEKDNPDTTTKTKATKMTSETCPMRNSACVIALPIPTPTHIFLIQSTTANGTTPASTAIN